MSSVHQNPIIVFPILKIPETRAQKQQREMATIEELTAQITALTAALAALQANQKSETEKLAEKLKEEATKNANKMQTIEHRVTNAKGYSMYAENEVEFKSIKDQLPEKITLDDLPMFKGTENPIVHIRAFKGQMSIKGVKKELWSALFPHSLESGPKTWFYSLEPKLISTWEDISVAFANQYANNMDVQASLRTLECLAQKENEGFSDYLVRWKAVSSQFPHKLPNRELIPKFVQNLRMVYQSQMRYTALENWNQVQIVGTRIEDDLRLGVLSKYNGKSFQGSSSKNTEYVAKNDDSDTINIQSTINP